MMSKFRNGLEMIRSKIAGKSDREMCRALVVGAENSYDEATRTVEAVLATESPVMAFDMAQFRTVHEVLMMDGVRFPKSGQVPLTDTHNDYTIKSMLGSTRNIRVEDNQLLGTRHLAKVELGNIAAELIRTNHLTDGSIRYVVDKFVTIEPGQSATIKGRKFTADKERALRVATQWRLKVDSVAPIGADELAKIRSDSILNKENPTMLTKEQRKYITDLGFNPDEISDDQARALIAGMPGEGMRTLPASGNPVNLDPNDPALISRDAQVRTQATLDEQERVRAIRELAGDDIPAELAESCITGNRSLEECQGLFFRHMRDTNNAPKLGTPAIYVDNAEMARSDLEAGLMIRAGFDQDILLKSYDEKQLDQAQKYSDLSLFDICRAALQLENQPVPIAKEEMMRAATSTLTLPTLLGAVAHKSVLAGYQFAGTTFEQWTSVGSVSNFKDHTRVRLTDIGDFEVINANGELANGTVDEESEVTSVTTRGKTFSISRNNIINDDLSLLTKIPQGWGMKAKRKINQLVYQHLLANGNMGDGVALFHATHGNLSLTTPLASAGLKAVVLAMVKQQDKDGQTLNLRPKYLIVPPDLEQTARELLESELLLLRGTTDAILPGKNIYKGAMELIVDAELSNTANTGYSVEDWYSIADRNMADTIEVSYLNGRQAPTVNSYGNIPGFLGIKYEIFFDAGVKAIDWRSMVKADAS